MVESNSLRILIADDEPNIRTTLARYCELEGILATTAENGLSAQRHLQEARFDAVVLDLRMPGLDGLELLHWITESGPGIPAIMISAHGDVADAVEAMRRGAVDYITKPFDPDDLILRLRRAVETDRLRRRVEPTPTPAPAWHSESAAMQQVLSIAQRVAPTDSTVLITGESGTGKEVLARRIHEASPRAAGPFVAVNLGAVPEQLLESELFGYERGAFTGAQARKPGLFETAGGGTLFLDEIGDMPVHMQVKLLRALQDRRIQRLGGTTPIPIDVRVLAATNANLADRIADGTFREDLYYRLNVFEVTVPALRERRADIAALAAEFVAARGRRITPEAVAALERYAFPGNIRELQNIVERAAVLAPGDEITAADLAFLPGLGEVDAHPPAPAQGSGAAADDTTITPLIDLLRHTSDGPWTLEQMERAAIEVALLRNEWHRERTAAELGITRRTLLNKIREYRLEPPSASPSSPPSPSPPTRD